MHLEEGVEKDKPESGLFGIDKFKVGCPKCEVFFLFSASSCSEWSLIPPCHSPASHEQSTPVPMVAVLCFPSDFCTCTMTPKPLQRQICKMRSIYLKVESLSKSFHFPSENDIPLMIMADKEMNLQTFCYYFVMGLLSYTRGAWYRKCFGF